MVADKLKQNLSVLKIKSDLKDLNISSELVETSLIDIAKETQIKNIENLRKKGLFIPELSNKQSMELKIAQRKGTKAPAGGAAGGKKEDAGKKKK